MAADTARIRARLRDAAPVMFTVADANLIAALIPLPTADSPADADIARDPIQLRIDTPTTDIDPARVRVPTHTLTAVPATLIAADTMRVFIQLRVAVATIPIPDTDPNLNGKLYGNFNSPENLVTAITRIVAAV